MSECTSCNCTHLTDVVKSNRGLWLDRLLNIAFSRFEYDFGDADYIDKVWIERNLMSQGVLTVYYDEVLKRYIWARVAYTGSLDEYGRQNKWSAVSCGSTVVPLREGLDWSNSVLVYNDYLRLPCIGQVEMFATKIALIDSIIYINANAQKTPYIIKATPNNAVQVQNFYNTLDDMAMAIVKDAELDPDAVTVLQTVAPYVANDLTALKHDLISEYMTWLGFYNQSSSKKERMVTDEVTANYDMIDGYRAVYLKQREEGIERCNKLFGTNWKVKFSTEDEETEREISDMENTESGDDE